MVGILFDLRGQRGLHVVRVVLDVVVLQDRLQTSSFLLPALLGTRHFGRQAFLEGEAPDAGRKVACLYYIFYCVLNRSPFLIAAFVLLAVVFVLVGLDVWLSCLVAPSMTQTSRSPQRSQMLEVEPVSCLALAGDPAPGLIG